MPSILFLLSFIIFASTASLAKNNQIQASEAREIAKQAYIFSYPLLMNYRTMYSQAIDKRSPSYSGFNIWKSYDPATANSKNIVRPNVDTPYSWAWVDLRTQPWVVTLPKIESERYYTNQWDDLWGQVLDNLGSIKDGNQGSSYLLVDSNWQGTPPQGIKRIIKSESEFVGGLIRIEYLGAKDLEKLRAIQKQYKLQPLSEFLHTAAPSPAPALNWPRWIDGKEKTEEVFSYVNFLLPFTYPNPIDKPLLDKMSKIGITAGKPWQPENLRADIRQAIQQGINEAVALLEKQSLSDKDAALLFGSREVMQNRYLDRAIGVYGGIFGNVPEQAIYIPITKDAQGKLLDASQYRYRLSLKTPPPVKYFWSVTIYSLPHHYLVDNVVNRYSRGSRSPELKPEADGSITLYIDKDIPVKDKQNNWLPAPNGPFYLVLRTYGPQTALINKSWHIPPVTKE